MSDLENHTTYYFGHFPLWIWQEKTNKIKRAEIFKKSFYLPHFYTKVVRVQGKREVKQFQFIPYNILFKFEVRTSN